MIIHNIFRPLSKKFSTYASRKKPTGRDNIEEGPTGRENIDLDAKISTLSDTTPSQPDLGDSRRVPVPPFENDKMKMSENIQRELQEKGFPKDPKVVDEIFDKHYKIKAQQL